MSVTVASFVSSANFFINVLTQSTARQMVVVVIIIATDGGSDDDSDESWIGVISNHYLI